MKSKKVIVLGACGSIGSQTLNVIRNLKDFIVVGVSLSYNDLLNKQIIEEFKPQYVVLREEYQLKNYDYDNVTIDFGDLGIKNMIENVSCKYVVNGLPGISGLLPSYYSIINKRDLLLANKETLVLAGEIISNLSKQYNTKIIPVDSEPHGIIQLLNKIKDSDIKEYYITASGGAIRDLDINSIYNLTKSDILNHPTWKMGDLITCYSSTMVNKVFEIIEAHFLFNIPFSKLKATIMRESLIHAYVLTNDNSYYFYSCANNMEIVINYALTKTNSNNKQIDLNHFSFDKIDLERYPLFKYASDSSFLSDIKKRIVFSTTNEFFTTLFLHGVIVFGKIRENVEKYLVKEYNFNIVTLFDVIHFVEQLRLELKEGIWT
jgi:1-deoxy-D-xylulose-5-phosphate reductoisomerase